MNADEMKQLAQLLQKMPGIKSVDSKDVKKLAQLLRDTPELGSIEVKGFFGTGVVITRTQHGAPGALPAMLDTSVSTTTNGRKREEFTAAGCYVSRSTPPRKRPRSATARRARPT